MGWNTAFAFIGQRGQVGYLGTFPLHRAKRATEILAGIEQRRTKSRIATLDEGLAPPPGWFCIGAYDRSAILCGLDELYGFVERPRPTLESALSKVFLDGTVLFGELASATNYFAYALYEDGHRRRAMAGDSTRGVVIDEGELQPEEKSHFDQSLERDGKRIFRAAVGAEVREFTLPAYGEALVFAMTARFLGRPLDVFPAENLSVEVVKKAAANPLVRLFRR